MTETHYYFWSSMYCQWYETKFSEDGIEYLSAEHYMMAKKAKLFDADEIYKQILTTPYPSYAKELGRQIPNFSNEVWDGHKVDIVTQGNYLKFIQNKELLNQLLADRHLTLVEASPVDKIWGVGLGPEDDRVLNEATWQGENLLGICIMAARNRIFKEKAK